MAEPATALPVAPSAAPPTTPPVEAGGSTVLTDAPQVTDWRAALPEDLRNDPTIQNTKDIAGMAKQLVDTQRMVGADRVAIPGENAPSDQWDAFFTKLGRPEKAEGYQFEVKSEIFQPQDLWLESLGKISHQLGLSKSQAQGLLSWYVEESGNELTQMNKDLDDTQEDAMTKLRTEFGAAFNDKLSKGMEAAQMFGGDEFMTALKDTGFGDNAAAVRTFIKIGEAMGSDTLGPGIQRLGGAGMTPQEASLKIVEIDKKLMDMSRMDPNRQMLVEEKIKLADMAHPDQAGVVAVERQPGVK